MEAEVFKSCSLLKIRNCFRMIMGTALIQWDWRNRGGNKFPFLSLLYYSDFLEIPLSITSAYVLGLPSGPSQSMPTSFQYLKRPLCGSKLSLFQIKSSLFFFFSNLFIYFNWKTVTSQHWFSTSLLSLMTLWAYSTLSVWVLVSSSGWKWQKPNSNQLKQTRKYIGCNNWKLRG